jgi:hypothetical protein
MVGDHLIHPREAIEMVPIELARLWYAQCSQNALRIPAKESGTSARHATASDPARMAFARSSFGGVFDVIPVLPPCVWTSTEMDLLRTSSAAEAVSAVWAAAVEPRGPTWPASIAPTEVIAVLNIQCRGVTVYP